MTRGILGGNDITVSEEFGIEHDEDDSSSSFEDGSGMSAGAHHPATGVQMHQQEVKEVQKLARKETRSVRVWRVVVFLLLLVTGAVVSSLTYIFLHREDIKHFTTSYDLFVHTIEDATKFHVENMVLAFQGLADIITAAAGTTNATFPFVTVPAFEIHGENARAQSGIETFSYTPLVTVQNKWDWQRYSNQHQEWIAASRTVVLSNPERASQIDATAYVVDADITGVIWLYDNETAADVITASGTLFAPIWQLSPPPFNPSTINYDMLSGEPYIQEMLPLVYQARGAVMSKVLYLGRLAGSAVGPGQHDSYHSAMVTSSATVQEQNKDPATGTEDMYKRPHSVLIQPIFEQLHNRNSEVVGLLEAVIPWDLYLTDLLPQGVRGIHVVLENSCGQKYSYEVVGNGAIYLGEGDFHDPKWSSQKMTIPVSEYLFPMAYNVTADATGHCIYVLHTYPSDQLRERYLTRSPAVFACVVASTFLIMAVAFAVYDSYVETRNSKVVDAAARSNAIVSSLFPSNVRDRLFADNDGDDPLIGGGGGDHKPDPSQRKKEKKYLNLKSFLTSDSTHDETERDATASRRRSNQHDGDARVFKSKPIADLFPHTTILFADIAGFTAWSSAREPSDVFVLLETVYRSFDDIAKRRRVFKVETVGDCYVAVTGLPEPRKDHAVVMARFARECMHRMQHLTKKLESTLGPDTADLAMRMGLHSGPVTAGVLRGERSRFQLFGDTMNTASRMETNGLKNCIHISQETADLLVAAGKSNWIRPREEKVVAKGKGELQTYWLDCQPRRRVKESSGNSSNYGSGYESETASYVSSSDDESVSSSEDGDGVVYPVVSAKVSRLIDWNADVLLRLLKLIVARRQALGITTRCDLPVDRFERGSDQTVLDEAKDFIVLPRYDEMAENLVDPESVELNPAAEAQLYEYVSTIASLYKENDFHNFEHASHVTMSVVKLLSRIVAPTDVEDTADKKELHDHTYGITSDPLTQFACVFSALIHDVDHCGVPNAQLVKENAKIAAFYRGKSIMEQNSVDIAWELLMDECYGDLRATIYSTEDELKRFRQLVVNACMATDILDKDLAQERKLRWDRAFHLMEESSMNIDPEEEINRKATIVIEHLIQASDVAHTMQHWHIYCKWNERLFREMYAAYLEGRGDQDPAEYWYQGEINFFDHYVLPLANKLKECGVFGVSSDEYLTYAQKNREEWEQCGQQVVSEMASNASRLDGKQLSQHSIRVKSISFAE